jgi:hypothetical protein
VLSIRANRPMRSLRCSIVLCLRQVVVKPSTRRSGSRGLRCRLQVSEKPTIRPSGLLFVVGERIGDSSLAESRIVGRRAVMRENNKANALAVC